MRTIDEIHAGRELVMAKDVLECFRTKTGRSIGLNTLSAWRAMDMPGAIQPPGQRYWVYHWVTIWEWYKTYSAAKKGKRAKLG